MHRCLLAFFLCFPFLGYSQNISTQDSLQQLMDDPDISDSLLIEYRNVYANEMDFTSQKRETYILETIELSKRNGHIQQTIESYHLLINLYTASAKFEAAYIRSNEVLTLAKSTNDKSLLHSALSLFMDVYYMQDRYRDGLKLFYNNLRDIDTSIRDLELFSLYDKVAVCHSMLENSDSCIYYRYLAIDLAEELDHHAARAHIYLGIMNELAYIGEFNQAAVFEDRFLELINLDQDDIRKSYMYYSLGAYYVKIKRFDEGIHYLGLADTLQIKYNLLWDRGENLKVISHAYEGKKNFEWAFKYYAEYVNLRDTLNSHEQKKAIAEFEEKYQNEKLAKEKLELSEDKRQEEMQRIRAEEASQKNKNLAITIGLLSAMSLLLLAFIILRSRIKQKHEKLQNELERAESELRLEKASKSAEVKAIKSQMNPHFIFNALNSIQSLILENDFRKSNKYLGRFSSLVRHVLESSDQEWVYLNKEIELLELYLDLEKLRFEKNFTYELVNELGEDVTEDVKVPPLLIQPYLENAIKHGLLHKAGDKHLMVSFLKEGIDLIVKVEDNGIGLKASAQMKGENYSHKSFATAANQKRIDLINETQDTHIEIQIEDGREQGTSVTIKFPSVIQN